MTIVAPSGAGARPSSSLLPEPLTDLLDEATATQLLVEAGLTITCARPDYLRHKPGETSIVSYRFVTPGADTEARGYAQWCAAPERAEEIYRKALTLRPRLSDVGVSTIRIDARTVFYGFPNDARLRRLRWYSTPRKLKPSLASLAPGGEQISKSDSTSTVLKYKPERRLVARVDLVTTAGSHRALLVRYSTGRQAGRLASVASALLDHGVQTPTPRAQLDDGRVSVDDFIEGTELRTWLRDHDSVAEHLAESLLAFHTTSPPSGTPRRCVADDLANAINGLLAIALWDRELGQLAREVAARLTAGQPQGGRVVGLIHGDLHDKNILVSDEQAWFIDLERTAVGSPASDLGRLRAHAISLDIRQPRWSPAAVPHTENVIDTYRSRAAHREHSSIDERTLGWHCAVALVDQALLVTRHVEADWEANAGALLVAAMAELRGRPVSAGAAMPRDAVR